MILTSSIDYESVCIDSSTVRFLSGITLAVSTINIFIFLFDLYIKYEIMSYETSTRKEVEVYSNKVVEEEDNEAMDEEDDEDEEAMDEEDDEEEEAQGEEEEAKEEQKNEVVV